MLVHQRVPRMMHQITNMIPCIAGVACKNSRSECLGFMNATMVVAHSEVTVNINPITVATMETI